MSWLKRIVKPLQSRKVRVALTTVIAAYLVEAGLEVSEEMILAILGVGVAVILGIAVEDSGAKSAQLVELPMATLESTTDEKPVSLNSLNQN